MLLSIIIPVFNVEPYLRECLDSVFEQALTDCEVIAVNDGSTDGSRGILEEYKASFPMGLTVIDKPNGGLSSARNAGVEQSKGDYIYFLDGDDYLKSHALVSIKQAIAVSENADVIYLDCIITNQGKRWEWHKETEVPLKDFRSFFRYAQEHKMGVAPNAVSYVYKSAYWRGVGLRFEEGIKYEDALFKYQLFVREDGTIKALHVEEPFYVYSVGREDSITTIVTMKNLIDKQYIRRTADHLWKEQGIEDVAYYHELYDACTYMLYEAYKSGLINQHCRFWDSDDVRIMRKGVSNEREYGLWLLAKLNPRWMAGYYANDLPVVFRKLTNRFLTKVYDLYLRDNKKAK